MADTEALRAALQAMEATLARQPHWPQLRAAHLDLVTATGQIRGAIHGMRREGGETAKLRAAEEALRQLEASVRQVGMDIRLASEGALLLGLQTALQHAFETLDRVSA